MARIAGINLPLNKRVEIGLTYVHGVGRSTANELLTKAGVDPNTFVKDTADPIHVLVARLDLEKYKGTIKGLTQFGDRRQGTDRNRTAVDWIEAQLKSYGCSNTERVVYDYQPPPPRNAHTRSAHEDQCPHPQGSAPHEHRRQAQGTHAKVRVS